MLLSKRQVARFWKLWSAAEREALPPSATREERDAFRREVIFKATGKQSLRDVGAGKGFDALMLEAAALAGDYGEAAYWGNGAERRYAEMMRVCARQIGEIAGISNGQHGMTNVQVGCAADDAARSWEYCRGVMKQAGLPERWEDVPEALLASTFKMLDTHRRRLLKSIPGFFKKQVPLAFSITREYHRVGARLAYVDVNSGGGIPAAGQRLETVNIRQD